MFSNQVDYRDGTHRVDMTDLEDPFFCEYVDEKQAREGRTYAAILFDQESGKAVGFVHMCKNCSLDFPAEEAHWRKHLNHFEDLAVKLLPPGEHFARTRQSPSS